MMSKDTIYREDAIKALHDEWDECLVVDECGEYIADVCENVIDTIPSADRPQGEWIETDMRCYGATVYKCSVCGDDVDEMPTVMGVPKYKFCPNCGARMKGADDEDDRCGCADRRL